MTAPAIARPGLSGRAEEVAHEVVTRLADPTTLQAAIAESARQSAFTQFLPWRDASVAGGHAGLALMFGAADRTWPGQGWDAVGHRDLARAAAAVEAGPHPGMSLYTGVAGLGHAAVVLAAGRDDRYRRLLAAVDAQLWPWVGAAVGRLDAARGCPVGAFDLVSGLTGVGVHLLGRRGEPAADAMLDVVLGGLARLLADRSEPRRWHTPAALAGEAMQEAYPSGHHNCGLAHGLPGPLALLSLAVLEGCAVPGVPEAVDTAATWLAEHRIDLADGPDWPNGVALDGPADRATAPGRASWCYGAPGVARSLWLAGSALDMPRHREPALHAMRAVLARPADERMLESPTFCHGLAGLLTVVAGFARDTGLPEFVAGVAGLTDELVARHEPASLLGYRDVEPGGVRVDQPALLDGAPGVALALMSAAAPTAPAWERLFLVS